MYADHVQQNWDYPSPGMIVGVVVVVGGGGGGVAIVVVVAALGMFVVILHDDVTLKTRLIWQSPLDVMKLSLTSIGNKSWKRCIKKMYTNKHYRYAMCNSQETMVSKKVVTFDFQMVNG